jgi:SAM-dependent methyltransferase
MFMSNLSEDSWAREQTCTPLFNNGQVTIAKLFAAARGLPLHPDRWKNWDSYLAIHHVERLLELDDPILDAGACRVEPYPSAFLPSLKKLGFTKLTGCNIDETEDPEVVDGVRYEYCDIERMPYANGQFAFITCLSTIEHGVDWRKYFIEAARVLRLDGYLFTSFDYWDTPVDTKGQKAFGAPIKIFTANDVMQMAIFAKEVGLDLMKRPVLNCKEAPVEWMGMRYTFMNLLMKKGRESLSA